MSRFEIEEISNGWVVTWRGVFSSETIFFENSDGVFKYLEKRWGDL